MTTKYPQVWTNVPLTPRGSLIQFRWKHALEHDGYILVCGIGPYASKVYVGPEDLNLPQHKSLRQEYQRKLMMVCLEQLLEREDPLFT